MNDSIYTSAVLHELVRLSAENAAQRIELSALKESESDRQDELAAARHDVSAANQRATQLQNSLQSITELRATIAAYEKREAFRAYASAILRDALRKRLGVKAADKFMAGVERKAAERLDKAKATSDDPSAWGDGSFALAK